MITKSTMKKISQELGLETDFDFGLIFDSFGDTLISFDQDFITIFFHNESEIHNAHEYIAECRNEIEISFPSTSNINKHIDISIPKYKSLELSFKIKEDVFKFSILAFKIVDRIWNNTASKEDLLFVENNSIERQMKQIDSIQSEVIPF